MKDLLKKTDPIQSIIFHCTDFDGDTRPRVRVLLLLLRVWKDAVAVGSMQGCCCGREYAMMLLLLRVCNDTVVAVESMHRCRFCCWEYARMLLLLLRVCNYTVVAVEGMPGCCCCCWEYARMLVLLLKVCTDVVIAVASMQWCCCCVESMQPMLLLSRVCNDAVVMLKVCTDVVNAVESMQGYCCRCWRTSIPWFRVVLISLSMMMMRIIAAYCSLPFISGSRPAPPLSHLAHLPSTLLHPLLRPSTPLCLHLRPSTPRCLQPQSTPLLGSFLRVAEPRRDPRLHPDWHR